MRLSLKELFGIVAYCAVLAWFASFFGFGRVDFWVSLSAIVVLSLCFIWLAGDDLLRKLAPGFALLFLVGGVMLMSLALFANAALLFFIGAFLAFRPARRTKTLTMVAMVCSIIALAVAAVPGITYGRKLAEMRSEYPVEEIAALLSYEADRSADTEDSLIGFSSEVSQRLDDEELHTQSMGNYRQHFLTLIHNQEYERFIRSSGFGIGRGVRPTPSHLGEMPLTDIGFDAAPREFPESGHPGWRMPYDFEKVTDLDELHTASRRDFVHPDGFGAVVEPRERVIGFIEHGFHYPMSSFIAQPEVWTLERLELVSLLKFEGPRVYVLDHLPRMDQLQGLDVPTRELDDFETESLKKLWTQEDVVIEEVDDQVRMLGSLRAASQCLDCHSVPRGTLLGAFSYVLTREGIAEVADSNGKHDPSEP